MLSAFTALVRGMIDRLPLMNQNHLGGFMPNSKILLNVIGERTGGLHDQLKNGHLDMCHLELCLRREFAGRAVLEYNKDL